MKISIKRVMLLLCTIILLYFVFSNLDFQKLLNELKSINYKYILILIISIITGLTFRGICFKQLIQETIEIPVKEAGLLCITCSALNIALPARAGDLFRAYYIGDKYKVDKIKIFGAIMFERILDMTVICVLLFLGVSIYHKNILAMQLCGLAFILIITSFIFALLTYKYNKIDKICLLLNKILYKLNIKKVTEKATNYINEIFNSFCAGFEIIESPKRILKALITSFIVWIFECINFIIVINAFDCNIHWSVSIFIVCFIVFSCLIPSTSIFIGPYQIAIIAAFSIYNISKETALAISFTEQTIVTITTIIIALIFLMQNNISIGKIKKDIK